MGRVAASRSALLEHNRRVRQAEGRMEQFALDEKARRLHQMKVDHQKELAKRFVMVDDRLLQTQPDSFRLLARSSSTARPLSATTARSMSQLQFRPTSAADLRPPALATSEQVFGTVGLRSVEPMGRMIGRDDSMLDSHVGTPLGGLSVAASPSLGPTPLGSMPFSPQATSAEGGLSSPSLVPASHASHGALAPPA